MAKAPEKTEGEAPPAKGSKKKLIIIIAVVVVLLVGGIVGLLVFKKSHPPADEEEADGGTHKSAKAKKGKPEAPPIMVKLDQFTVKLQANDDESRADHYMQATLELEVLDNATGERIKVFMSKIRAKVLLMLMGKTPAEMSTPQGIETLTSDLRNEINKILDGTSPAAAAAATGSATGAATKPNPDDSVQAVYLTQFLVQ